MPAAVLNVDDSVAFIRRHCGFRASESTENAAIIQELNVWQWRLDHDPRLGAPWFNQTEDDSLSMSAEDWSLAVPSDFLFETENYGLYIYDSSDSDDPYKELIKDDFDILLKNKTGTAELPTHYALRGSNFYVFPINSGALSLRLFYVAQSSALSSGGSATGWLRYAWDLLVGHAGLSHLQSLHNESQLAVAFFQSMVETGGERHRAEVTYREETNLTRVMGGDD